MEKRKGHANDNDGKRVLVSNAVAPSPHFDLCPCASFAQLRGFDTFLSIPNALNNCRHVTGPFFESYSLGNHQLIMAGIASAVVLPDQDADSPPPTGSKRRQSSISEYDAKRARLNEDDLRTARRDSVGSAKAVAAPPKGRERGRERRLFGAALGALAQNSATAGQKRRSEIEKRQQAQRKVEEEESEQRKQERQARRKAQRWREHRQFEKDSVRASAPCASTKLTIPADAYST